MGEVDDPGIELLKGVKPVRDVGQRLMPDSPLGLVLHHGDGVAVLGEQVVDGPPAGPVDESAVDQHDGRWR